MSDKVVDLRAARMEHAIQKNEGHVKAKLGPDGNVRFEAATEDDLVPAFRAIEIEQEGRKPRLVDDELEPVMVDEHGKVTLTIEELERHKFGARVLERIEICDALEKVAVECDQQAEVHKVLSPPRASAYKIRAALTRDSIGKIVECIGRDPSIKARSGRG